MKASASIAVLSILATLAGSVHAASPIPQTTVAPKIAQASQPLDVSLLVKTLSSFFLSDRYETKSVTEFKGKSEGLNFTVNIQTKTIAQSDKKFRSQIAFGDSGKKIDREYLVISDGKQVWIYRPDLKQYAVISYNNFDDSFFIGMSSSSFMEAGEDARQLIPKVAKSITSGELSDKKVLEELGLPNNENFKGDKSIIEGEDFYVYNYTDNKEGFIFRAFVQPETATLKQFQMAGKTQSTDFEMTEKILNRTANPVVTKDTFKFTPPKGAKRVKSISISPF
jgi:outer membrane lipoprotein-sorting protein